MRLLARTSILILVMSWPIDVWPAEPSQEIPSEVIIQRFTVAKDGDFLLLPVRLQGKDHMFVVDTGSTHTCFDPELLQGEPRGKVTMGGPYQFTDAKLYDSPKGTVGVLPLHFDMPVPGVSLEAIRQQTWQPIQGILGMDWLNQHIIHINYDRGELLFLKSASWNTSQPLPLFWQPRRIPRLQIQVKDLGKSWFMIDTGHIGLGTGLVSKKTISSLLQSNQFQQIHKSSPSIPDLANNDEPAIYKGLKFRVGNLEFDDMIVAESLATDQVNNRFLSRFTVTLDFPGRTIYLQAGKNIQRPDRWDSSGFELSSEKGIARIKSIAENSSGWFADFKPGDILLKIGDFDCNNASHFKLVDELTRHSSVKCLIQRGQETREVMLLHLHQSFGPD